MHHLQRMLESHPRHAELDVEPLTECINVSASCAATCRVCADACLAEPDVQRLVRCITTNLDCADICATTERILARRGGLEIGLVRQQLELCATACRACADECERHAERHEHCRLCADECRRCAQACDHLLAAPAVV